MPIYFNANDNLMVILRRVQESPGRELILEIPEHSVFWQNPANRVLLEQVAKNVGKSIRFGAGEAVEKEPTVEAKKKKRDPGLVKRFKHWPKLSAQKVVAVLVVVLSLAAFGTAAFMYYFLPRAEIVLLVAKKPLEEREQITIDPQAGEVRLEERVIPGRSVQVEMSAKKDFSATGSKTVGERALGEVTIQNWTNATVVIDKGTILTVDEGQTGAGLKFTTDNSVEVPSQTTDTEAGVRKAGSAQVPVTATVFGEEYNLPPNLDFVINERDFSSFSAINKEAFSGGTTEEVTIVTQEDLNQAQAELKAELFAKGEEALTEKVGGDEKIAKDTIDNATAFAKFSHDVGAETDKITLTMRTVSQATVYQEKQLKAVLLRILKESVPEGFKLSPSSEVVTAHDIKRQGDGTLAQTGG